MITYTISEKQPSIQQKCVKPINLNYKVMYNLLEIPSLFLHQLQWRHKDEGGLWP